MKKITIFLAIFIFAITTNAQVEPTDTNADGFRNVSTLDHLKWITENSSSWADKFKLDNDIDASATSGWTEYTNVAGFKPIATGYSDRFTGTFDGNNFAIKNLYIHSDINGIPAGFIAQSEDALIENLTIENCDILSTDVGAGSLIGKCETSTINNCSSSGTVNGDQYTGGLISMAENSTIDNCSSSVDVPGTHNTVGGLIAKAYSNTTISNSSATGNVSGNDNLGGFVGWSDDATISNCFSLGTVVGVRKATGGFIGANNGSTITDCYSRSSVTLTGGSAEGAGGFAGTNNGSITLCYAMGSVLSEDSEVGGFVGNNQGSIQKSYSIGNATGHATVGGFVGQNETSSAIITNCYSRGNVIANVDGHNYAGGFVGKNHYNGNISYSYSTGTSTAPNSSYDDIGGFSGNTNSTIGIIENCYWDMNTSNLSTSYGGVGKNTSEMKVQSTFDTWDFNTIWTIETPKNDGYPHLSNYVVGIKTITPKVEFALYPNPANNYININTNNIKIITIEIYEITGRLVTKVEGNNSQIDISELVSGVYLIKVTSDKGFGVNQFIKK